MELCAMCRALRCSLLSDTRCGTALPTSVTLGTVVLSIVFGNLTVLSITDFVNHPFHVRMTLHNKVSPRALGFCVISPSLGKQVADFVTLAVVYVCL